MSALNLQSKVCVICSTAYQGTHSSKYCSDQCRAVAYPKAGPFSVVCVTCGVQFVSAQPHGKYCSDPCRAEVYQKLGPFNLICVTCSVPFVSAHPRGKYCSKSCRPSGKAKSLKRSKKPKSERRKKRPLGRYVYAWFRQGEPLPFYVGRGVGNRASRTHHDDNGRLLPCESERRLLGGRFEIRILRDRLTAEGSRLVEAVFIDYFESIGCRLTNIHRGSRRQERPPLTLSRQIKKAS